MSIADLVLDGIFFVENNWPSLVGIAAAFALRRRIPPLRLPRLRDWQACALVAAVSLASSLAFAALHGIPLPWWHDDYAYLLTGDTFAHGRLANPPHPLSDFFETMHVLQRPAYIGKYPPGQGAVLAIGFLLGQPIIGIWMLCAAACAAIWWALRQWLTPELALLGGLLTAIHPTMLTWAETYHGGALAALAGALIVGAAGKERAALVPAAIGMALFAYSRPYEGLVFMMAMFIVRPALLKAVPIAAVGLVPLLICNRAVTGNPLVMPYMIYEQRYDPMPNFLWERPRRVAPEPNLEMATVYRVHFGLWRRLHQPGGLRAEIARKIDVIVSAVFGPPLLILFVPLAALPRVLKRDPRARRFGLVLLIFAFAPFSIIWWAQTHYLAPAVAVVAALMVLLVAELPPSFAAAVLVAFAINAGVDWARVIRTPEPGNERQRREIAASIDGVVLVAPQIFD
ncbi:MAG TPA: hypothetical protein VG323_14390, partial [Thermoanaerobaculia bacterium]|nr:hypothetical protein [Thermoanaerobaculia bacterium]